MSAPTPTPYSALKIFAHPKKISDIENKIHSAPLYIRIKPTNACNHNCNFCHYASGQYLDLDNNPKDFIPENKMSEIIEDMKTMGVKAVTFSGGGEPLVYPYIKESMEKILEYNIDLSIITNGHLLKGENANLLAKSKWVRISFEAATSETYSKIRNLKDNAFGELCSNIEGFAKIKNNNCELGINFVVTKENANEVYSAGKLLYNLGANHIKYAARITDNTHDYHKDIKDNVINQIKELENELKPTKFAIINKYEHDFDTCSVFKRSYSNCIIKSIVTVIAADSKVYYCNDKAYLKNGVIGDISKQSFKELWFDKATQEKFEKFNALEECNHHCVRDDRNILLNTFFALDKNHINYI